MAIKARSTVCAVKEEVTQGTLVEPSAATDFIPLLSGAFDMDSASDQIISDEIKNSIGPSESIPGLEKPTGSLDQYLKHSGVEGQAPSYSPLLKGAFGAVEVNGTEYPTAAGSTTTVINVGVGVGANFSKGEALLIKDSVNGYSIRCIKSIAGDALTLDFALSAAPAAAVNLGKAVFYSVQNSSHPSLSMHLFNADGYRQAVAGARVSSLSMDVNAGEPVVCSFEFEGTKHFFDPITITATSKYIDAEDDGGNFTAILTEKTYKNPEELAAEIQTKLDGASTSSTVTCVWNATGANAGKFTITATGTVVFKLEWLTGANTANSAKTKLGFNNTDDTGALTYSSDVVQSYAPPVTPTYDSASLLIAKYQEVLIGKQTDNTCFGVESFSFSLTNTLQDVKDICAETGIDEKLISGREVSLDFVMNLKKHNSKPFDYFYNATEIGFQYSFGTKVAGNWEAGKSGALYISNAKISAAKVAESDDIVTIEGTIQGFVPADGSGECFLNFV